MDNKIILLVVAVILIAGSFFGGKALNSNQVEGNLGYRENTKETSLLTSSTAAYGDGMSVAYYRNIGITVANEAASGTIKFQASLSDTEPTWSVAKSVTNTWDYVQVIDTEDGSTIDGDTGIVYTNDTDVRLFESNSNNFRWFNVERTSITNGTSTVKVKPSDNQ